MPVLFACNHLQFCKAVFNGALFAIHFARHTVHQLAQESQDQINEYEELCSDFHMIDEDDDDGLEKKTWMKKKLAIHIA